MLLFGTVRTGGVGNGEYHHLSHLEIASWYRDFPTSIIGACYVKGEEMRIVPIVHCTDVEKSLAFYTGVLGFKKKDGEAKDTDWVIDLVQGGCGDSIVAARGSMFASPTWTASSRGTWSASDYLTERDFSADTW